MQEQTNEKLMKIAGVRFRENWKVYDFDAAGLELAVGDKVIVDSDRGAGMAQVVRIRTTERLVLKEPLPEQVIDSSELEVEGKEAIDSESAGAPASQRQAPKVLRKILRKATGDDIAQENKNRSREDEAFTIAQDMIAERELPMKLIRVEYSFDASRAIFFFFSETRVDFRELVKDLAHKLKSRIEMRQIGVRDVARMIGGYGLCGRELCCAAFLKNFEPVSIRMAKKQEMVLNPAKISGVCGRLLCCLSYEYGMYDAIKKDAADMRETAAKGKKEEEVRRIEQEQREIEDRRLAEDKKRQDERRQQQEQRKEKQKENVPKTGVRSEARKDQSQDKKTQPASERIHDRQQPKPEQQQPQEQKTQQPQQNSEKPGKKKRRRFWRKKKKGQQSGENKPQSPEK
jgi:cell fate regulator YaaT (PSP1 superfamily)